MQAELIENEAERISAGVVRLAMERNKLQAYELLRMLVTDRRQLKYCGYLSLEDATNRIINGADSVNEKLMKAHEKKFPLGKKS